MKKLFCKIGLHAKPRKGSIVSPVSGNALWVMDCPRCSKVLGVKPARM